MLAVSDQAAARLAILVRVESRDGAETAGVGQRATSTQ